MTKEKNICQVFRQKREKGDCPQFHIFTKNHYFYILSNDHKPYYETIILLFNNGGAGRSGSNACQSTDYHK